MGRRGAWLIAAAPISAILAACAPAPVQPDDRPAAVNDRFAGWTEFVLPGKRRTRYEPVWDGGRAAMRAEAVGSASMLRRPLRLEPAQLAKVQFSWRVDATIPEADLSVAETADSPVRVVFAFDGDHGQLSARNRLMFELAQAVTGEPPPYATLMYVWDNRAAPESVIASGRSDRVRKIVLETGAARCGRWLHYDRDLAADYRRAFGEAPGTLIGVALMTDADNTASRAAALYGEVALFAPDGRRW